jgi:asparagine synthase (glutamine-hydrolysing)
MSIIFGIRKPEGDLVEVHQLLRLALATERWAPDNTFVQVKGRVGMGFQPYHTHRRSSLEAQPVVDDLGNMVTLDGRIDNHKELCELLEVHEPNASDSTIVLAAFKRWGEKCFSNVVGDWAITIWSEVERTLYLARDHAGTRTLYFHFESEVCLWSTHLESFCFDGKAKTLDDEYVACYLSNCPVRDLTPYRGVRAVPPAHVVLVRDGRIYRTAHWAWMAKQTIQYRSDSEYEEHFIDLFRQSIARRTGMGDAPILAQLSGGMDSTAIVCMSDHIRRSTAPDSELLDTLSFYDDSDPNWDERPYFSLVERQRAKTGIHLNLSFLQRTFQPHDTSGGSYPLPGADGYTLHLEQLLYEEAWRHGYRSILSGIGGDEVLGGVPDALPELADCLVSGNIVRLLQRSLEWCLIDRSPIVHSLLFTVKYAFSLYTRPLSRRKQSVPQWVSARLARLCAENVRNDLVGTRRFGIAPHCIDNGLAWWSIMESLPHLVPTLLARPEYRYPYLDRDLVSYLFSIPREQLLRPGRRRSLMRRALAGIVPPEILERRRKAFQLRGPLSAIRQSRKKIDLLLSTSTIARAGFVDPKQLSATLELIASGNATQWWQALMRAIAFELWLEATPSTKIRVGSEALISPVSPA